MSESAENITYGMETMKVTSPPPNLDTIASEIRLKIVEYVLADPQQPDFYAANVTGKYPNYLSIWFVNKTLSQTTDLAVKDLKDLVVLSSNFDALPGTLLLKGIPIVSTKAIHKVKCHVMRLHVKFPGYEKNKIACSILMRKSDLEELAKCLRILSLTYEHDANELVGVLSPIIFPRMSMIVRFEKSSGEDLSTEMKCSLMMPLTAANKIGKISFGDVDPKVSSILPGHDEKFRPWRGQSESFNEYFSSWTGNFNKNRQDDGDDYIKLGEWLMELGDAAMKHNNIELAARRYNRVLHMGACAQTHNPRAFEVQSVGEFFLRNMMKAALHMAECFLGMGYYESARSKLVSALSHPDADSILNAEEHAWVGDFKEKIKNRDKSKDIGDGVLPEPWQ